MRGKMESVVHMRVSPIKILAQLFDRKIIVVIICETLLKVIEFTTTNGKNERENVVLYWRSGGPNV
jgi:hypothetical protein